MQFKTTPSWFKSVLQKSDFMSFVTVPTTKGPSSFSLDSDWKMGFWLMAYDLLLFILIPHSRQKGRRYKKNCSCWVSKNVQLQGNWLPLFSLPVILTCAHGIWKSIIQISSGTAGPWNIKECFAAFFSHPASPRWANRRILFCCFSFNRKGLEIINQPATAASEARIYPQASAISPRNRPWHLERAWIRLVGPALFV